MTTKDVVIVCLPRFSIRQLEWGYKRYPPLDSNYNNVGACGKCLIDLKKEF